MPGIAALQIQYPTAVAGDESRVMKEPSGDAVKSPNPSIHQQPESEQVKVTLLIAAFNEVLTRNPTAPNIYLAEDSFVKGSGRLVGLAHYELLHLELAYLGLQESYNPELEAGNWVLAHAVPAAAHLALPFSIWRCHKCQGLTPSNGEEGCAGLW